MQNSIILDHKSSQNSHHDLFEIKNIDLNKTTKALGLKQNTESIIFDFFNHQIRFSKNDFQDTSGIPLTNSVKNVCASASVE